MYPVRVEYLEYIKNFYNYNFFVPTKMAIKKKMDNDKYWWGHGELGPSHIASRNIKHFSSSGIVWQFQKLKRVPIRPGNSIWGTYQRDLKTCHTEMFICIFIATLFTGAKKWKILKGLLTGE